MSDPFLAWLAFLEARHLADRTFPEVRKGLQALSSLYVQRRGKLEDGAVFDGAGKRAAFGLFYAPLHFLVVRHVVRSLGAAAPPLARIVDLGCGTGPGGAAWALETGRATSLTGVERSGWAAGEARATYRQLGIAGRVATGDLLREKLPGKGVGVLATYTVNELGGEDRDALLPRLLDAADRGARVLVVEPIATRPWWPAWAAAFAAAGGRADEHRFPVELPEPLRLLDRASGLDHRELTARTLYAPGR